MLDIGNIGDYVLVDDDSAARLRLVRAMPALTPAADAIVATIVRRYGAELFATRAKVLRALVHFGPVRYAQFLLGCMAGVQVKAEFVALGAEFERIFAQHPAIGYAQARRALAAMGLPDGSAAHPASPDCAP